MNKLTQQDVFKLMTQGVIVKNAVAQFDNIVSFDYESLGIKLNAQSKIVFNEYLRNGGRRLFPRELVHKVSNIKVIAFRAIEKYSFETLWGQFMPICAINTWKKKDDQVHDNYYDIVRQVSEKYDIIVNKVGADYSIIAKDVWNRLYPNNQDLAPQSYIDNFRNKMLMSLPTRENLILKHSYRNTYLQIPNFLNEELTRSTCISSEIDYYTRHFVQSTIIKFRQDIYDASATILRRMERDRRQNKRIKDTTLTLIDKFHTLNFYGDTDLLPLMKDMEIECNVLACELKKDVVVSQLNKIMNICKVNDFYDV